jgi:hypothetical protein
MVGEMLATQQFVLRLLPQGWHNSAGKLERFTFEVPARLCNWLAKSLLLRLGAMRSKQACLRVRRAC